MIKKIVLENCDFIKLKKNKSILIEMLAEIAFTDEKGNNPVEILQGRIKGSTDYESNSLVPLKQSTLKIRKLRGRSGTKPLIDTGKLLKTIKWKPTKTGGKLSFNKYGWHQAEGFTTKNHFAVKKGRKILGFRDYSMGAKIPPRPFINTINPGDGIFFISKEDRKQIIKTFRKYMVGKITYRK